MTSNFSQCGPREVVLSRVGPRPNCEAKKDRMASSLQIAEFGGDADMPLGKVLKCVQAHKQTMLHRQNTLLSFNLSRTFTNRSKLDDLVTTAWAIIACPSSRGVDQLRMGWSLAVRTGWKFDVLSNVVLAPAVELPPVAPIRNTLPVPPVPARRYQSQGVRLH